MAAPHRRANKVRTKSISPVAQASPLDAITRGVQQLRDCCLSIRDYVARRASARIAPVAYHPASRFEPLEGRVLLTAAIGPLQYDVDPNFDNSDSASIKLADVTDDAANVFRGGGDPGDALLATAKDSFYSATVTVDQIFGEGGDQYGVFLHVYDDGGGSHLTAVEPIEVFEMTDNSARISAVDVAVSHNGDIYVAWLVSDFTDSQDGDSGIYVQKYVIQPVGGEAPDLVVPEGSPITIVENSGSSRLLEGDLSLEITGSNDLLVAFTELDESSSGTTAADGNVHIAVVLAGTTTPVITPVADTVDVFEGRPDIAINGTNAIALVFTHANDLNDDSPDDGFATVTNQLMMLGYNDQTGQVGVITGPDLLNFDSGSDYDFELANSFLEFNAPRNSIAFGLTGGVVAYEEYIDAFEPFYKDVYANFFQIGFPGGEPSLSLSDQIDIGSSYASTERNPSAAIDNNGYGVVVVETAMLDEYSGGYEYYYGDSDYYGHDAYFTRFNVFDGFDENNEGVPIDGETENVGRAVAAIHPHGFGGNIAKLEISSSGPGAPDLFLSRLEPPLMPFFDENDTFRSGMEIDSETPDVQSIDLELNKPAPYGGVTVRLEVVNEANIIAPAENPADLTDVEISEPITAQQDSLGYFELFFAEGDRTQTFDVTFLDDSIFEGNEALVIRVIGNGADDYVVPADPFLQESFVQVEDDEQSLVSIISLDDEAIAPPDVETAGEEATFLISITEPSQHEVHISVPIFDEFNQAVDPLDFDVSLTGDAVFNIKDFGEGHLLVITLDPGETSVNLSLTPNNSFSFGSTPPAMLDIDLFGAGEGAQNPLTIDEVRPVASFTVNEESPTPIVSITTVDGQGVAAEADGFTATTAQLRFERDGNTTDPLRVFFTFTWTPEGDPLAQFTMNPAITGTGEEVNGNEVFYVDIPAGQSELILNITPIDDATPEDLVNITVELQAPPEGEYLIQTGSSETVYTLLASDGGGVLGAPDLAVFMGPTITVVSGRHTGPIVPATPGTRGIGSLTVVNQGSEWSSGRVTLQLWATRDGEIGEGAVLLSANETALSLFPDQARTFRMPFTVPLTALPGDYELIGRIIPPTENLEDATDANDVTSNTGGTQLLEVNWAAGRDTEGNIIANRVLQLVHPDDENQLIVVRVIGDGIATLVDNEGSLDLEITGTNNRSSVYVTARDINGEEIYGSLDNVEADSELASFRIDDIFVSGDLSFFGGLRRLDIDELDSDHLITIGGDESSVPVSIRGEYFYNVFVDSSRPILSTMVREWEGSANEIEAPSLGRLVVFGDTDLDLDLHAAGDPPRNQHLGSAVIRGELTGEWYIDGNVQRIFADSLGSDFTLDAFGEVSFLVSRGNSVLNLAAETFGRIIVSGDVTGGLIEVHNNAFDQANIAQLTIRGHTNELDINAAGSLGTLMFQGNLVDSQIHAGISEFSPPLPEFAEDFDLDNAWIDRLVAGSSTTDTYTDSNIAAAVVRNLILREVTTNESETDFGVATGIDGLQNYNGPEPFGNFVLREVDLDDLELI